MPAPVSQLQTIQVGSRSAKELAPDVTDACISLGFLYLTDTGLEDDVEQMFKLSKEFFLGERKEEKEKCARGADNMGYVAVRGESLDPTKHADGDLKELINIGYLSDDKPPKALQPIPPMLQKNIERLADFERRCHRLSRLLLESLALALGLADDFFSSQHLHDPSDPSILRMIRYPALPASTSSDEARSGAHSDYGSCTLLMQERGGAPGLEVLPPEAETDDDDQWQEVPVIPGAVLVNIGDVMEFWSGALFKSTMHRVRQKPAADGSGSPERYSIVFFCQPVREAPIKSVVPATGQVTERDLARMERKGIMRDEVLTAGEHLQRRLDRTYK